MTTQVRAEEPATIIPYEPAHRAAFKALNVAWISKYFRMEEADYKALDDPEGYILGKGGYIFMAQWNGDLVGACALIKIDDHSFELAKMAVDDKAKGLGMGYTLGSACIEQARKAGAHKVELLSNTILEPAIHLYRKLGFKEVPLPATDYERANIKMELDLI